MASKRGKGRSSPLVVREMCKSKPHGAPPHAPRGGASNPSEMEAWGDAEQLGPPRVAAGGAKWCRRSRKVWGRLNLSVIA